MIDGYNDRRRAILRAISFAKQGMSCKEALKSSLFEMRIKHDVSIKDLLDAPDIRKEMGYYLHGGVVQWGGWLSKKRIGYWWGYDIGEDTLLTIENGETVEYPNGSWRKKLNRIVGY